MSGAEARVSGREAEVLAAVGAHLSNAQIAERLLISVRTVESHVSSLLRKYGVSDRRTLARLAQREQSGPPEPWRLPGLSVSRTRFIGRGVERESVLAALDASRLVTLLGPGGVGKTRLAVTVAATATGLASHGGGFVDLVPVRGGFVAPAVAAVLGVTDGPQRTLDDAVVDRLRSPGQRLLVLDNCEHVLDEVSAFVDRILSACPDTRVLATSRERIGLTGERVVPIGPLPLASDAEELFYDRACAADPGFDAEPAVVAHICNRLDGMPLAIELAAARAAALGVDGVARALDDALHILTGRRGGDPRHRSLGAVIGWSYDLLDEREQALFRRLSLFVGSSDLNAVAGVMPDDTLAGAADLLGRLVDKSLVVYQREARRWRLLETVRGFALDHLDRSGERADIQRRHLHWAARTAGRLEDTLREVAGSGDAPGATWPEAFDLVADDLRAALAAAGPEPGEVVHRLARSLARLTYARRFLHEAVRHYRTAADRAPDPAQSAVDLRTAAAAVYAIGHAGQAFELLLAAADQARAGGNGNARSIALAHAVVTASRFPSGFPVPVPHERLSTLLREAQAVGDPSEPEVGAHLAAARVWYTDPGRNPPDPAFVQAGLDAARATGDPALVSGALDAVGTLASRHGRLREAHRVATERLGLLALMDRSQPHHAAEILDTFHVAWLSAFAAGDLPAAHAVAETIFNDELLGVHPYRSVSKLVPVLIMLGRFDEGVAHARRMWEGWRRAGSPTAAWMSPAVSAVALAHGLRGDERNHLVWQARATPAVGARNPKLATYNAAFAAFVNARLAVHTGQLGQAAAVVEQAFADFSPGWHQAYAVAAGAELAVVAGLHDAAERLADAARYAGESDWAAACLARAGGRLHQDHDALTASLDAWERIDARFERACTLLLLPDRAAEGRAELAALGIP